ncbi:MAG: MerR family DNA-binding protein [Gemmatimonadetes bacterium]|nr:MerR family DNA-binding protein [Gemmatimonadota bacterium]
MGPYGAADVARVRFIKAAQGLGFSLDEVAELLHLDDGAHCDDARVAAETKLHEVGAKLASLRRIERALARLVTRCQASIGRVHCPLIEACVVCVPQRAHRADDWRIVPEKTGKTDVVALRTVGNEKPRACTCHSTAGPKCRPLKSGRVTICKVCSSCAGKHRSSSSTSCTVDRN